MVALRFALLQELVCPAVLRFLVVAPAADLRPVADPVVGDVVEGDLDHQLGAQLDPLELALAAPAARIAHAALAGLVGREPRRQLALLGCLEAGRVPDDAQVPVVVVEPDDERADRALLLPRAPPDDDRVDRAHALDLHHPDALARAVAG